MVTVVLPHHPAGRALRQARAELFAAVRAAPDGCVIVDASRVADLAPAGVTVLLALAGHARRRGVQLMLCEPSAAVRHALARSHAGRTLMLHTTAVSAEDHRPDHPEPTTPAVADREDASTHASPQNQ